MNQPTSPNTISIIIPTYRRKEQLLHVLDCLVNQTIRPDEVFVVDASPEDEQIPTAVLRRFPPWLEYIPLSEAEGNASAQRNMAIILSRGEILIFIDDDVHFDELMIKDYIEAFSKTGADAISGRISIPGKSLDSTTPITKFAGLVFNPGAPNYLACDFCAETYVICTANFAAKRNCIVEIGGFDEQIHGTIDDVDLGLRLVKRGYRVIHYPYPYLIHFMAKGSGARSAGNKLEWSLANVFYFQLKNFPSRNRPVLLWDTILRHCRPSRLWRMPRSVIDRAFSVWVGYRVGLTRLQQGARYLRSGE